jgi:hypothetical protein
VGAELPRINAHGLASQAEGLAAHAWGILSLLTIWVLEPVLGVDSSESGHRRALYADKLWNQAWDAIIDSDFPQVEKTEELVASSEELQLEEEPNDLSVYRVDFLAALLYALRSYSRSSQQYFTWCLQRTSESIAFLNSEANNVLGSVDLDEPILITIQIFESEIVIDRATAESLKNNFASARNCCEQACRTFSSYQDLGNLTGMD